MKLEFKKPIVNYIKGNDLDGAVVARIALHNLASHLGQASKQLSQTIVVIHLSICEEDATNMLNIRIGQDGILHIVR